MSCARKCHSNTLNSANRHTQPRWQKSLSFLDLPGEIRNKIYDLLYTGHVLIYRSHPVQERRENPEVKSRLRLGCRRIYAWSMSPPFYIAPDLLRVCRQVHDEAVTFLYANTTFRFESVFATNKFLNIVPTVGAIKKLELRHSTYGEPRLMEDRKWKQLHDKKWTKTCRRIAKEMTALQDLKIDLRICDWPTQLNLTAAWAKALLELRGSKGVNKVKVTLRHDAFNLQRLQAAANVVARALMSEEGRVRHELAENVARAEKMKLQRSLLSDNLPKATKVLVIKPAAAVIAHSKNKCFASVLDGDK